MIRLLKLKYPWQSAENSFEYKGRFGPNDKSWTDEVKKTVNFDSLDADEFFMTVEAFKYAFKTFMIGHHKESWKPASFVEKRNAVAKKVYRFNFTITDENLGITQQPILTTAESESSKEVEGVFNAAADAMQNNEHLDAQMAKQGLFDIESMIPDVTDL